MKAAIKKQQPLIKSKQGDLNTWYSVQHPQQRDCRQTSSEQLMKITTHCSLTDFGKYFQIIHVNTRKPHTILRLQKMRRTQHGRKHCDEWEQLFRSKVVLEETNYPEKTQSTQMNVIVPKTQLFRPNVIASNGHYVTIDLNSQNVCNTK